MIVDITVENFGPFRDATTLSMEATNLSDSHDAYFESERTGKKILKSASVFGANASGKSYLFDAVDILQRIVGMTRPEGTKVPGYMPFRLSKSTVSSPSSIGMRMIIDGSIYAYTVSFTSEKIVREALYHSPNGRTVPYFFRGIRNEGMRDKMEKLLTDSSAYLSVASSFNDPICNKVLREIMGMMVIHQVEDMNVSRSFMYTATSKGIEEKVLRALDAADMGIYGFTARENDRRRKSDWKGPQAFDHDDTYYDDIRFVHRFEDADVDDRLMHFPINIESNGTVEMFSLMGPIAKALEEGRAVLIDEFGSDLHPSLTRWIVGLFNTSENDSGAQLIVNTHDIGLMDIRNLYRRDQIWFTNKNRRDGSCELYSLADFKGVLKNSDIRQDYLMGRFDAIPWIVQRHAL